MSYFYKEIPSPVGELKLVASDAALIAVLWENDRPNRVKLGELILKPNHPVLRKTEKQLAEYFAGKRKTFDLAVEFVGTAFQKKVWKALAAIPFGKTLTYAEIARKIGRPTASRAVGAAVGRNPSSIVTPCHRVVGSDGSLTGFAGGMPAKARLLQLEGHTTLRR
jgi:methylated-DNA-[protein]-cysteine S-methyltransferase